MLRHVLGIATLTLAGIACVFLPLMPGEYDPSAFIISTIATVIAFAALLLVPIGLAISIFAKSKRTIFNSFTLGVTSLLTTFVTAAGALATQSKSLAGGLVVAGLFVTYRVVRQADRTRGSYQWIGLYLIFVPAVMLAAWIAFADIAIDFARSRSIENARPLIEAIESYHIENARYPESLLSQWEDYDAGIIGVERYYYEPNGSAYNLYFEQFSPYAGSREFVMYNKFGEHKFSAHNADRLELSPDDQIRQAGWHAKVDLAQENWKSFLFD